MTEPRQSPPRPPTSAPPAQTTSAKRARPKQRAKPSADDSKVAPSARARMLALIRDECELWHDAAGERFASFTSEGERRHVALESSELQEWLAARYLAVHGEFAPLDESVLRVAKHEARGGPTHEAYVRVASHRGCLFYDLGAGRVVRLAASGRDVIADADSPVRFLRSKGSLVQVEPARGGRIDELWKHVNVPEVSRPVVLAWLVAALRPGFALPVLVIEGEQGSAKSWTARVLRSLIDPHGVPLRRAPTRGHDVELACKHAWVLAFDNVSGFSGWLSDLLCGVATGSGTGTRRLYTDSDETLLGYRRPVLLNGIEARAGRADLADRAYFVRLPPIDEADRVSERVLAESFDRARPLLLGALFDGVVRALQQLDKVSSLPGPWPRMADAAAFAMAAATSFGLKAEEIRTSLLSNRTDTAHEHLADDPVAAAVISLAAGGWSGTPTDALRKLAELAGDEARRPDWPRTHKAMRAHLDRIAPALRRIGVSYNLTGSNHAGRVWSFRRRASDPSQPSQASAAIGASEQPATPATVATVAERCA